LQRDQTDIDAGLDVMLSERENNARRGRNGFGHMVGIDVQYAGSIVVLMQIMPQLVRERRRLQCHEHQREQARGDSQASDKLF